MVGILGAGPTGARIAQLAFEAGQRVLVHDPGPGPHPAGVELEADLERLAAMSDIVIEDGLGDLITRRAAFARIDAAVRPATILATTVRAPSLGAMAEATRHPERVAGLHVFGSRPPAGLLEIVATARVDPILLDRVRQLAADWRTTAVRSADAPGFIVERIDLPLSLEALAMLGSGLGSVERIDRALRAAGFPIGPFERMDAIGVDVCLASSRLLFETSRYEPRFRPSVILERLVEAGRLGRSAGEGFYWYADDGRSLGMAGAFIGGSMERPGAKSVQPRLVSGDPTVPPTSEADGLDALAERLILAVVNEAYRALGDGVASVADIDLAMRLGADHPYGPFEQVERLGGPHSVILRLAGLSAGTSDPGGRFEPAPALLSLAADG